MGQGQSGKLEIDPTANMLAGLYYEGAEEALQVTLELVAEDGTVQELRESLNFGESHRIRKSIIPGVARLAEVRIQHNNTKPVQLYVDDLRARRAERPTKKK